jgi:hypothetical protein
MLFKFNENNAIICFEKSIFFNWVVRYLFNNSAWNPSNWDQNVGSNKDGDIEKNLQKNSLDKKGSGIAMKLDFGEGSKVDLMEIDDTNIKPPTETDIDEPGTGTEETLEGSLGVGMSLGTGDPDKKTPDRKKSSQEDLRRDANDFRRKTSGMRRSVTFDNGNYDLCLKL